MYNDNNNVKKETKIVCTRCKIASNSENNNSICLYCEPIHEIETYEDSKIKTKIDIAREAYQAREMRKHYEDIEKELIDKLKIACEGKSFIEGGFIFSKSIRSGGFDYASAVKDKGIDVSGYRKENITIWKLSYEG